LCTIQETASVKNPRVREIVEPGSSMSGRVAAPAVNTAPAKRPAPMTCSTGVEDETLACGAGVAGSAYVAHRVWGLPYPLRVGVRGGEMQVDEAEHGLLISGVTGHLSGCVPAAVAK
jgi:diaminopimelate epimerase